MAEYIEREEAINALMEMTLYDDEGYIEDDEKVKRECFESWLNDVPAADVKPVVHGKWKRHIIDNGHNAVWKCSECGYKFHYDFISFNYCPSCGADMRESEGEDA